jgi:hypothetical protein
MRGTTVFLLLVFGLVFIGDTVFRTIRHPGTRGAVAFGGLVLLLYVLDRYWESGKF